MSPYITPKNVVYAWAGGVVNVNVDPDIVKSQNLSPVLHHLKRV